MTFQSMDNTSSIKKVRQHLINTEMGTGTVLPSLKSAPKTTQSVGKILPVIDETISTIKNDLSLLQTDNANIKSSLDTYTSDLSSRIVSLEKNITDIKALLVQHTNDINSLINDVQVLKDRPINIGPPDIVVGSSSSASKIEQLSSYVNELASKVSGNDRLKRLHVGEDFNLPEQPSVQKEGGAHKVAPLAFVVNGAVLLHDIGYTTDNKGLVPLYYDPVTQRALIYNGK